MMMRIYEAARRLANKYHVPLEIHLSETKRENDDALQTRGMTPTRLLDTLGVLDGPTIAAHGVWLDDADLQDSERPGARESPIARPAT